MLINADLHIHGKYSRATSKSMSIGSMAVESRRKGIDLIATGDCLHKGWLKQIKQTKEVEPGTFEMKGMRFILTTEIEDNRRVHHLLFFPSLDSVMQMRKMMAKHSKNLDTDGRPNIRLGGEEIAGICEDLGVEIGPCHAFTPWTALYGAHDSLESCYGSMTSYLKYIELGLSADTNIADQIKELQNLTFLTNSDAHSAQPVRLAREFNRIEVKKNTYKDLMLAIKRKQGRKFVLNVGIPPQEGKYHESACIKCYTHYSLNDAMSRKWKCGECGKRIKKGVVDRVNELADWKKPHHPDHRPPYQYLVPLAEIIQRSLGTSSPFTKKVQGNWEKLVNALGSEIDILLNIPLDKIEPLARPEVFNGIRAFREGKVIMHPGGGGEYGWLEIPGGPSKNDGPKRKKVSGQKTLGEC